MLATIPEHVPTTIPEHVPTTIPEHVLDRIRSTIRVGRLGNPRRLREWSAFQPRTTRPASPARSGPSTAARDM
jgi:hypothetical protein